MIEFYKYLYAGMHRPRTPTNIKNISQKWKSQINVSSCPANITPVKYEYLSLSTTCMNISYEKAIIDEKRAYQQLWVRLIL